MFPDRRWEQGLSVPGEHESAYTERNKGHQSEGCKFGGHVNQCGSVIHDLACGRENVCKGEYLGYCFNPPGRSFKREPYLGQEHHGPGDEVQDAGGKLFTGSPCRQNQSQGGKAETAQEKDYEKVEPAPRNPERKYKIASEPEDYKGEHQEKNP